MQSMVSGPVASASPGNLAEMQIPGPTRDLTKSCSLGVGSRNLRWTDRPVDCYACDVWEATRSGTEHCSAVLWRGLCDPDIPLWKGIRACLPGQEIHRNNEQCVCPLFHIDAPLGCAAEHWPACSPASYLNLDRDFNTLIINAFTV